MRSVNYAKDFTETSSIDLDSFVLNLNEVFVALIMDSLPMLTMLEVRYCCGNVVSIIGLV